MYLLSLQLGFLEIAIFMLAVVAFILAIRFFMDSHKNMEELLPEVRKKRRNLTWFDRSGFLVPKNIRKNPVSPIRPVTPNKEEAGASKEEIKMLRQMLLQQQHELSKVVEQIAQIKNEVTAEQTVMDSGDTPTESHKKFEQLRLQLSRKDAEIKRLKQKEALSEKLQQRFEEVQVDFEALQEKMMNMEQQAWQAADLAIKLDHVEQSNFQFEKNLLKKEEKLRELSIENQRLHDVLNDTEDKLSEANLQRQQLFKKNQFLEEINSDMKLVAETNRRLKIELNRVAELESMLNLITEERDALLLRKK